MKVLDKLELIDRIGRELQARMTYSDIDAYFSAHGVDCSRVEITTNSKWVYVKEVLSGEDDKLILEIADELEIDHNHSLTTPSEATFWKAGYFRLFISHLAKFKKNASVLQEVLRKYGISAFVAHEDIEPSKEWQVEIEKALHTMDAMVTLLMPGFNESDWCDQEVGVAIGRNVPIVPVKKRLDPYGFIGKFQAIQGEGKTVGEVAELVFHSLLSSNKTRAKLIRSLCNAISQSTDLKSATKKVILLSGIDNLPINILENLSANVAENKVLAESKEFLDELNSIFEKYDIQSLSKGWDDILTEWDDDIPF